MTNHFATIQNGRALRAWSLGIALVTLAACRDKANGPGADSTLAKDLALAGQQTAQPTFKDTAIAPTPSPASVAKQAPPAPVKAPAAIKPKPKPKAEVPQKVAQTPPPAPAPTPVEAPAAAPMQAPPQPASIGSGTSMAITAGSKVCTTTNLPGDKLVATVNNAVTGLNGGVIPAGANVVLEIAAVQPGQDAQSAKILFRVRSVIINDKTYNVDANVTLVSPLDKSKVDGGDPNAGKKKVIGGAIIGGILGQVIGHNTKGTIIGAAAGAATGAAVSHGTEKWQACLPSGASLQLTLNAPLVLQS
jgi:outer membrane protein with glycine zipper